MSTLVGLTGGFSCSEVGIHKFDCHQQVAESVKVETYLKNAESRKEL